jgi:hypothetical protein
VCAHVNQFGAEDAREKEHRVCNHRSNQKSHLFFAYKRLEIECSRRRRDFGALISLLVGGSFKCFFSTVCSRSIGYLFTVSLGLSRNNWACLMYFGHVLIHRAWLLERVFVSEDKCLHNFLSSYQSWTFLAFVSLYFTEKYDFW